VILEGERLFVIRHSGREAALLVDETQVLLVGVPIPPMYTSTQAKSSSMGQTLPNPNAEYRPHRLYWIRGAAIVHYPTPNSSAETPLVVQQCRKSG
jgi:hypothetical protein